MTAMRFTGRSRAPASVASENGSGVRLSESYLAAIAWIETLPENRSGSDKTWVEQTLEESRLHFAKAVRVS
jgi:hypothetical protein